MKKYSNNKSEEFIENLEVNADVINIIYSDGKIVSVDATKEEYQYLLTLFQNQIIESQKNEDNLDIKYTNKIRNKVWLIMCLDAVYVTCICAGTFIFKYEGLFNICNVTIPQILTVASLKAYKMYVTKDKKNVDKDLNKFLYYEKNKTVLTHNYKQISESVNNEELYNKVKENSPVVLEKIEQLEEFGLIDEKDLDYNIVDQLTKKQLIKYKKVLRKMQLEIKEDLTTGVERLRK